MMFASVRLSVTPDEVQARPGDRVTLVLTVKNASTALDRYRIAVSGVPATWCEIEPDVLSLYPDADQEVRVVLAPPAGMATAAGTYPLTITATSEQNPRVQTSVLATLVVAKSGGLRLVVSPAAASGKQATFYLELRNDANAPAVVSLLPRDLENGLLFSLANDGPVTVPAGEHRTVALRVAPKVATTVGDAHLYDIEVRGVPEGMASSGTVDSALVTQANFTYIPRVRSSSVPGALRRMPLWLLLLLPLLLLALVFLAGTRSAGALTSSHAPPTPTITTVPTSSATTAPTSTQTVTTSHVTQPSVASPRILGFSVQPQAGGKIKVTWITKGASKALLNGKPVATNGSTTVADSGPSTLILSIANAAGGTASRSLVVAPGSAPVPGIAPAVAPYLPEIKVFAVTKGAGGSPVLSWQVVGADTVQVDGQKVPAQGLRTLTRPGPATYTIVAGNRFGSVTSSLLVPKSSSAAQQVQLILHPPVIERFTLAHSGSTYTMVWATTGAATVLLNGKKVDAGGNLPLGNPQQGSTFDLVASNRDGSSHAQVKVVLGGGGSPGPSTLILAMPQIVSFSVAVQNGQSVATWRVNGALHVVLNGTPVAATGSQTVAQGIATLTLLASNDVGVRQRQIPVVGPTPTFPPTATATPMATATHVAPGVPTPTATVKAGKPAAATAARSTGTAPATATPPPNASSTPTSRPAPAGSTNTAVPTSTRPAAPTNTAIRTSTSVPPARAGVARAAFTGTKTPLPTATNTILRPLVWTRTPTVGPALLASHTATATGVANATSTPTRASTATNTPRPGVTNSATVAATATNSASASPTNTPSVTPTRTPTATATLGPPVLTVAPASIHFPNGNPASQASFGQQQVTITNSGPSALTISNISITGTDAAAFGQSGCPSPVAAGKSCVIAVSFNSATSDQGDTQGNYTASLVITDNAADSPQKVALTAGPRTISAAPPQVTLSGPPAQNSGGAQVNAAAQAHAAAAAGPLFVATVTVTNNGPGPLPNVAASFQGSTSGFTAQVAPSCQNLAQGANCQVTVGFTPPPGLTSAPTTTLVLTPQGGSGPISIPLTINPLPTTTFASSVAITYSTSSQIVSLNATVTSPAGTVDEGTVTFTVNGTSITSGPLSNGGASVTYTAPAGLGTSEVKAVYNPGPLFTTSSGTATLTVSPASTTTTALDSTATCAFSCINPTAPLTATVTSPAGTVSVGSVTFTVTDPNSGATIGTATGAVSNGQATANLTFSCGNSITFTIQAVYDPSPSGNFTGSRSGPATLDAANVCG